MLAKLKWRHRLRVHGFRTRMQTADGRKVLNRRRAKGRVRLTVQKTVARGKKAYITTHDK